MGMEDWCNFKLGLIAVNTLILVLSFGFFFLGCILQSAYLTNMGLVRIGMSSPAILIILVGFSLFGSSLFGLMSTIRESHMLLSAYICIMVMVILFELAVGATMVVMKSSVKALVVSTMQAAEEHYNRSKPTACMWDAVQNYLQCCGMKHFEEWRSFLGPDVVPDSCCIHYSHNCGYHINNSSVYQNGCLSAIQTWYFKNQILIGVLCTVFILIQLVAIQLGKCYCNQLNLRYAVTRRYLTLRNLLRYVIRS